MNARFQIAIHILTLLDHADGEVLSSDYMAGSLNTNPALVRKEISNLRNHGLIDSKEGKGGGYTLSLSADKITLDMIYRTVKTGPLLGSSKNQPNPACPIGRQIGGQIGKLYDEVDHEILTKLSTITLAEFSRNFD
ncbi:RrF2 family transcriptional regulator [Mucilaginibacter myungsuensis]|uniref:Rrf2 family transcriptional regulator n=1 Tax=Mucilaginibacter myungsuensis TaxID=649104 RepID=A0A929KZJ2_9SPHI|nr:Rrf2 family transcriptional regulator [Mucilaginibacter myungsuensis]MBE9660541.1 Rrf2 family transcriptional regulator [Mucilaginibacter myungsuensis]MDN3600586.1 Rrf2 family transcriptional regulator [Mucilaginibacter myungsuensis]